MLHLLSQVQSFGVSSAHRPLDYMGSTIVPYSLVHLNRLSIPISRPSACLHWPLLWGLTLLHDKPAGQLLQGLVVFSSRAALLLGVFCLHEHVLARYPWM
jgi:hypothetical protein